MEPERSTSKCRRRKSKRQSLLDKSDAEAHVLRHRNDLALRVGLEVDQILRADELPGNKQN